MRMKKRPTRHVFKLENGVELHVNTRGCKEPLDERTAKALANLAMAAIRKVKDAQYPSNAIEYLEMQQAEQVNDAIARAESR